MNILARIQELADQRGWSINFLAKKAKVSQSTLSGLFLRNNCPTIPTLEKLCKAFGITMSEFFAGDQSLTKLTDEQRYLLNKWNTLSDEHKQAVLELIEKL
jgi:transcriptional regulator with XRE-family HTH domain